MKGEPFIRFDPRTKIFLILTTVAIAMTASSIETELGLIAVIALFGVLSRRIYRALVSCVIYLIFYLVTYKMMINGTGTAYVMLMAWGGLFSKVYPCAMMSSIVISTTGVSEFLCALTKMRVTRKLLIPLAIMLRYIPTVKEDWRYIKDAMKVRDLNKGILGRIRKPMMYVECMYVPLMMTASEATDELSIAAIARGIENPIQRTCLQDTEMKIRDVLILLLFIGYFIAGLIMGG